MVPFIPPCVVEGPPPGARAAQTGNAREAHGIKQIPSGLTPAQGERVSSVLHAERTEHSAKPDEFYQLIEGQYPTLPKIEPLARRARDGWDAWGNQVSVVA